MQDEEVISLHKPDYLWQDDFSELWIHFAALLQMPDSGSGDLEDEVRQICIRLGLMGDLAKSTSETLHTSRQQISHLIYKDMQICTHDVIIPLSSSCFEKTTGQMFQMGRISRMALSVS